ncbi:MAG: hypothetical protein AAF531_03085 [Actinomycetota bacterium]
MAEAIEAGRVSASRVGEDGITIPWHAFVRPDDDESAQVATLLARYCQAGGGLRR